MPTCVNSRHFSWSCRLMSSSLWLMSYSLWLMSYSLWLMSYSPWLMSSSLWLMSYSLWLMSSSLWLMSYSLWLMSYSLWLMSYSLWLQWIPSVLRKTLNSCWPKTYGKKDMEKIWKIMGWSALLPKIKKRTKTLRDSTIITFPHFWGHWGVFPRQMCPVTTGWVDNCVLVGKRPYACLTISGSGVRCAANARHNRGLHIRFSLMKKVPFGRFQPLSFDFISRNNGSWAF